MYINQHFRYHDEVKTFDEEQEQAIQNVGWLQFDQIHGLCMKSDVKIQTGRYKVKIQMNL